MECGDGLGGKEEEWIGWLQWQMFWRGGEGEDGVEEVVDWGVGVEVGESGQMQAEGGGIGGLVSGLGQQGVESLGEGCGGVGEVQQDV